MVNGKSIIQTKKQFALECLFSTCRKDIEPQSAINPLIKYHKSLPTLPVHHPFALSASCPLLLMKPSCATLRGKDGQDVQQSNKIHTDANATIWAERLPQGRFLRRNHVLAQTTRPTFYFCRISVPYFVHVRGRLSWPFSTKATTPNHIIKTLKTRCVGLNEMSFYTPYLSDCIPYLLVIAGFQHKKWDRWRRTSNHRHPTFMNIVTEKICKSFGESKKYRNFAKSKAKPCKTINIAVCLGLVTFNSIFRRV